MQNLTFGGRATWAMGILLHVLLSVYFVDARLTANPISRALPVVMLFEERVLHFDRFAALTPDKAKIRGHYYSDKAPLASAITALGYLPVRPLLGDRPATSQDRPLRHLREVLVIGGVLCGSIPFVLLLWLCFGVTGHLSAARRAWLVPLAVYGGFLHIYAGVLMGHLLGALFVVLSYRALFERQQPVRAGLALGLAFLTEYPLLLALPLWTLQRWILGRSSRDNSTIFREVGLLFAGFVPSAIAAGIYNKLLTGNPLIFPYKFNASPRFSELSQGYGLALPSTDSVLGLTFSPHRGVFFYAPILLLLLVVLLRDRWRSDRRDGPHLSEAWRTRASRICGDGAIGFFLVSLLFYMARATEPWPLWTGGYCYGPRYMIPASALLLYAGLQVVDVRGRGSAMLFASAGAIGVVLSWMTISSTGFLAGRDRELNPILQNVVPQLLERGPAAGGSVLAQSGVLSPTVANLSWVVLFALTVVAGSWLWGRASR